MNALFLSLAIFLFWTLSGRSIISLVFPRHPVLKAWLLAPAIGLSTTIFAVTFFNQWGENGIPVKFVAFPILAGLSAGTIAILLWRRPVLPWKQAGIFAGLTIFYLVYAGWPLFQTGWNWLSYGNDDMANYCMAASRSLDNGFYRLPTMPELEGTDYTQYLWFMHVAGLMRFGSELTLSWVAGITGLNPLSIFMPVLLALGLTQLWSLAYLVLSFGRFRLLAYGSFFLLSVSPLFGLSLYYQLIAQVGGLALMLAALGTACSTLRHHRRASTLKESFLLAISAACLCIFYPEVTPFCGLSMALYWLVLSLKTKRWTIPLPAILLSILLIFVFLRENSLSYLYTLTSQISSSALGTQAEIRFPYFMVPSGLPTFFGWISLDESGREPVLTILIVFSLLLAAVILAIGVIKAWKPLPWASLFFVMLLVAVQLFRTSNSFGVFKLAMFFQPSAAVAVASLLLFLFRKKFWLAAVIYALCLASTWMHYGRASLGQSLSGLCHLPRASQLGFLGADFPKNEDLVSEFSSPPAMKVSSILAKGSNLQFPSSKTLSKQAGFGRPNLFLPPDSNEPALARFSKAIRSLHPRFELLKIGDEIAKVCLAPPLSLHSLGDLEFPLPVQPSSLAGSNWLLENPAISLFNKLGAEKLGRHKEDGYFLWRNYENLSNRLVFIESSKGKHYYNGFGSDISIHQAEKDYFNQGSFFNGFGRYILFEILNPDKELWLRLNLTRTLQGGGDTKLPKQAKIIGKEKIPIPFTGEGSANIYAGPFQPADVAGLSFIGIDFGQEGKSFKNKKSIFEKIFGINIPMDPRSLIGFARDFSLLSAEEYKSLKRPLRLNRFPQQLVEDAGLEYSGLYEDGWISSNAFFILGPGTEKDALLIRGHLPGIGEFSSKGNKIKVRINGGEELLFPVKVGNFSFIVPHGKASPFTRVEIRFDRVLQLPSPDDRPSGGKLISAEMGSAAVLTAQIAPPMRVALAQLDQYESLESEGLFQDGWVERKSLCVLGPTQAGDKVVIKGNIPKLGSLSPKGNRVKIRLNHGQANDYELPLGEFHVEVPCKHPGPTTRVDLEFESETPLRPPDTRKAAARLSSIEIISIPL